MDDLNCVRNALPQVDGSDESLCRPHPLPEAPDLPPSLQSQEDDRGRIPLHRACESNSVAEARLLLQSNPGDQVLHENMRRRLPLHIACEAGATEVVRLLLQYNPTEQILHQDCHGRIPLHKACWSGSLEIVDMLLEHLPEKQIRREDYRFRLPIHSACWNGSTEIVRRLLDYSREFQIMHRADVLHSKLLLHFACERRSLEIVQILLGYQPEVQLLHEDEKGNLPIWWACLGNDLELITLLLFRVPLRQILHQNAGRKLLLHDVCKRPSSLEVIKLLLQYTPLAQITHMNTYEGKLPIRYAVEGGGVEIVTFLLQNQSSFQMDNWGDVLAAAYYHNQPKMLGFLLELNLPGAKCSFLVNACGRNYVKVVEQVLKYHPNSVLGEGRYWYSRWEYPVNVALQGERKELLQVLLQYHTEAQLLQMVIPKKLYEFWAEVFADFYRIGLIEEGHFSLFDPTFQELVVQQLARCRKKSARAV